MESKNECQEPIGQKLERLGNRGPITEDKTLMLQAAEYIRALLKEIRAKELRERRASLMFELQQMSDEIESLTRAPSPEPVSAYMLPAGTRMILGKRAWVLIKKDTEHPDWLYFREDSKGANTPDRVFNPSEVDELIKLGARIDLCGAAPSRAGFEEPWFSTPGPAIRYHSSGESRK